MNGILGLSEYDMHLMFLVFTMKWNYLLKELQVTVGYYSKFDHQRGLKNGKKSEHALARFFFKWGNMFE